MHFLIALLFVSTTAQAQFNDDHDFDYLSWCADNAVMAQNNSGQAYMVFDCTEQGRECRHFERRLGTRVLISAACVDRKLD